MHAEADEHQGQCQINTANTLVFHSINKHLQNRIAHASFINLNLIRNKEAHRHCAKCFLTSLIDRKIT